MIKFLHDLIVMAVDIMLEYFLQSSNKKSLADAAFTSRSQKQAQLNSQESKEEEMNRQCAIRYLREAKKCKENLVENIKDMLQIKNIRREDLEPILRKDFFRSFHIRQLLTKNFNPDAFGDEDVSEIHVASKKF